MNTKKWNHDPVYQGYPGSWSLTKTRCFLFWMMITAAVYFRRFVGKSSQSPNEYGFKKKNMVANFGLPRYPTQHASYVSVGAHVFLVYNIKMRVDLLDQLLLMVQRRSGDQTSWGVGSAHPIIYMVLHIQGFLNHQWYVSCNPGAYNNK